MFEAEAIPMQGAFLFAIKNGVLEFEVIAVARLGLLVLRLGDFDEILAFRQYGVLDERFDFPGVEVQLDHVVVSKIGMKCESNWPDGVEFHAKIGLVNTKIVVVRIHGDGEVMVGEPPTSSAGKRRRFGRCGCGYSLRFPWIG